VFGNVFWVVGGDRADPPRQRRGRRSPEPARPRVGRRRADVRRRLSDLISILAERDYLLPLDAADSSVPGDVEVVFKHNLERDLMVRRPSRGKLARYHLLAAQWLEASGHRQERRAARVPRPGSTSAAAIARRPRAATCWAPIARAQPLRPDEARGLYEKGLALLGEHDAPARWTRCTTSATCSIWSGESRLASASSRCSTWRGATTTRPRPAPRTAGIARVLRRQGQYDPAMEHLRRASELFERRATTAASRRRSTTWAASTGCAAPTGRPSTSTARRWRCASALGDRRSIALSLANIGRVHFDSGNFKAAISQFREALDLRRDIDDRVGVVQSLCGSRGRPRRQTATTSWRWAELDEARAPGHRDRRQAGARRGAVARRRAAHGVGDDAAR
jgi:tetratricopeptide (TPR) repeat protein